jgi:hypothetical protein
MHSGNVSVQEANTRLRSGGLLSMLSINPSSLALVLSRMLVVIAFVAQIAVVLHYWSHTWDDAAITLGFSRTFELTGRIEPTPGSGIVEGYSTTLWMLLMAAAAKFVSTSVDLVAVAKISTLLLNLANIVLIRRWFASWSTETCANLIAGSMGCGLMFYESINGMETPLLLTLIFVMLLLLPSTSRTGRLFYLLAGSAFLLTRWEAAWLLAPFVLVESSLRRALTASATWLSVFIASNLVRWHYFGSLLPNTITAKSGFPYTHRGLGIGFDLQRHFGESVGVLLYCKFMFVVVIACLLYERFVLKQHTPGLEDVRQSVRNSWQFRFTLIFTIFSLILTTAIGPNFGPDFRSFYCGWPFLFYLLFFSVTWDLRSRVAPWATATLCLLAVVHLLHQVRELNGDDTPHYMPGATIDGVAFMGSVLSDIQSASHHPQIVYAGPDMGGVMLFTSGVKVVDLGLLCDPVLAHQRYAAIGSYVLEQRRPDVIEVHQHWTEYTNLQAYPNFLSAYRPVYVHGVREFVSRSLLADIDPSRVAERAFDATGHPDDRDVGPSSSAHYLAMDYKLNKEFGTYLVLRSPRHEDGM